MARQELPVREEFGYYLNSSHRADRFVGAMMKVLGERGVLDDTLLVFAGDNGMFLGEHGMTDKRTMHEASIRLPLGAIHQKSGYGSR